MFANIPRVGMRMVKTALAVAVCFLLYFLRGEEGVPVFSTIAAIICMQPYTENSIQVAINRIFATLLGAVFALLVLHLIRYIPDALRILRYMVISFAVIPVMYVTVLLKRTGASALSGIVLLSDCLSDVGYTPLDGAINRSVLIATDYVAIPLAADLFSLQGLQNLGPTLRSWKNLWSKRLSNWKESREYKQYSNFHLPAGKMQAIGYLCQQPSIRLDRPVKAYDRWVHRMPAIYREFVLNQKVENIPSPDPECLATIKHYRSLIPMGQEFRKPIFDLTPADGASGSHAYAVQSARKDFRQLAEIIAAKIGLKLT